MTDVSANGEAKLDVDYDFWGSMPGWTMSEAAALLLDMNPDKISIGNAQDSIPGTREWEFHRLHRRLKRARTMEDIDSPTRPSDFVEWAISNKLHVSDVLKESVQSGRKLANWRTKYFKMKRKCDDLASQVDDVVTPKERNSLLKMVLGMARSKFGHAAGRSAVKSIEGALADCNLAVTDDVIRKYLAEAEEKFAE